MVETSRLRLRPWRDTDAPDPGEGPDAASARFMPAGAQPGPEDFPAWLARRRLAMATGADLHWCIADVTTDAMLGNVQIFGMGPAQSRFQGEVGYWLRPGARGRGFVGEAIEVAVAHAFRPVADGGLGLTRLHAATDSDNDASRSILASAGFTRWGTASQAWRRADGSLSDGEYFELLSVELPAGADHHQVAVSSPPRLDAERVRLRPWSDDDLPRLLEGLADLMSLPLNESDESDTRQWLARRRAPQEVSQLLSWCIADRSTDKAVGNIDAFDIRRPVVPGGCELGYWTHPDSRGRGLMTEALRRLLPHLLGSTESGGLGLRRVTARTSELNVPSQSVLRAIGMRRWGTAPRASIAPDGSEVAQVYFAVFADEPGQLVGCGDSASGVEPVTLEGSPTPAEGSPRIRLREWRRADAERVVEACSDVRAHHWLAGSLPSPYTLEHAQSYLHRCGEEARSGTGLCWCVADAGSDLCLGAVSVMALSDALGTSGEVGYWAHPDARGRGVMSEAVRLAVRHAFIAREDGGLGRKRLRLNVADGNSASRHIARASGFVEVGRDRQAEPLGDGTFADLARFDLLADEWDAAG